LYLCGVKADQEKQIDFIVSELRKGSERVIILQKFAKVYKVSTKTFDNRLKIAKDRHFKQAEEVRQAMQGAFIESEQILLKQGLKSKEERQLSLQKQIDDIEKILDDGITPDAIVDNKAMISVDIERKLTAIERANLMKVHRELIAELNKMDGSYAPAETKTTITDTRPPAKVKLPDGTEIEI